jgi:DNA-binding MarR family transcriptional regulator
MSNEDGGTAQKLMETFARFNRVQWKQGAFKGVKPSEIMLMFFLRKRTPPASLGIKVSELSRMLHVTPPTVTQLVNGLVSGGYVERQADEADRRAVNVRLSPRGEELTRTAFEGMISDFEGLVGELGEEGSRELSRLMARAYEYFRRIRDLDRIPEGQESEAV